ncbi:unnamed protein product [Pleuronectes platessa]|uniref:Uncharacterized protein n=1 Tax=Pleuronectes platessa TaxID=8262 RepID=A0A9N7VL00_PLEPL|nr:unnamed protein product [Pleuronectes platessa]
MFMRPLRCLTGSSSELTPPPEPSNEHDTLLVRNSDTPVIHYCVLHSPSSFTRDMPTHQPMRACYASVSAPSRSLELGSRVILARCPDRSVKKEEEMFLYLECGHFISRIYSRSNTRITSRWRREKKKMERQNWASEWQSSPQPHSECWMSEELPRMVKPNTARARQLERAFGGYLTIGGSHSCLKRRDEVEYKDKTKRHEHNLQKSHHIPSSRRPAYR